MKRRNLLKTTGAFIGTTVAPRVAATKPRHDRCDADHIERMLALGEPLRAKDYVILRPLRIRSGQTLRDANITVGRKIDGYTFAIEAGAAIEDCSFDCQGNLGPIFLGPGTHRFNDVCSLIGNVENMTRETW